jgi:hypothetical protein
VRRSESGVSRGSGASPASRSRSFAHSTTFRIMRRTLLGECYLPVAVSPPPGQIVPTAARAVVIQRHPALAPLRRPHRCAGAAVVTALPGDAATRLDLDAALHEDRSSSSQPLARLVETLHQKPDSD